MKLINLIVAGACMAVGSGAWAENITSSGTSLNSGSAYFGAQHKQNGTFTDTFNFSGGPTFADASSILSTISLAVGDSDINFTSASLNGVAYAFSPNGIAEFGTVTASNLAGPFSITVTGTASGIGIGSDSASYSGTLNVTAVPEPGTYAMMLAGLAAVGFIAARRPRNG